MRYILGFLSLASLLAPTAGYADDILVNGSFEVGPLVPTQDISIPGGSTDITGWTVTGHSIDYLAGAWDVSHGSRAIDLDGDAPGGIEQTFATIAGRTYLVSFDVSGNPQGAPVVKEARVSVDGITHDYSFDSSGQRFDALLWKPTSLSFVASGATATLSFTSLTPFAGSYGALIDHVRIVEFTPAPDCAYSFSSGTGASRIALCVTANGTIVHLEAPAGQEHVGVEQVWEGYIVCSGTTAKAWDISATESGFGSPTVLAGPTATGVTLRRSSDQVQLDQEFKLDKKNKAVVITMVLKNISPAALTDVHLARAYDPDPNNDSDNDLEVKSARSVWSSDVDAVTLTGLTRGVPTDTAIDTGTAPACSPASSVPPTLTGDSSLAVVTYRLGNLNTGAKKQVVFVYRVQ